MEVMASGFGEGSFVNQVKSGHGEIRRDRQGNRAVLPGNSSKRKEGEEGNVFKTEYLVQIE